MLIFRNAMLPGFNVRDGLPLGAPITL